MGLKNLAENKQFPPAQFQTKELSMWIIDRKTVSDEMQESHRKLEIRFRSSKWCYSNNYFLLLFSTIIRKSNATLCYCKDRL
jgi:hypothetical protein